jgi:hypothetical protein
MLLGDNIGGGKVIFFGRFGCIVLEFGFQLDTPVYTSTFDNIYPQFRLAPYFLGGNCCIRGGGGGRLSVYKTRCFVGYEL